MIGYLEQLENNPSDHFHLMNTEELTSQGFAREITIARLDPPNPEIFDPVTRRLIME